MTELICITCPKGCHLRVDEEKGFAVTGNSCPRGAEYGRNELQHPVRTVTSTVRIQGADLPRLPVKTDRPLPENPYHSRARPEPNPVIEGDLKPAKHGTRFFFWTV